MLAPILPKAISPRPITILLAAAGTTAAVAVTVAIIRRRRLHAAHFQLCRLSAVDAVAALKEKRVTPSQLLEACIARVQEVNPQINAVVQPCFERARARAAQATAFPGPLYGCPILIKDNMPLAGERWTSGTSIHASRIASATDPAVEQVELSGGLVFGTTNMPEFALGSHTFNALHGLTRNPHDLTRSAGGSSGGSAAAVASGLAPLALGTDLGGSLRNPAAFCGIVGLRPSPGRVAMKALEKTAWRGWWGLGVFSVAGPLARTVADAALALDALAPSGGPVPADNWVEDVIGELIPPPPGGFLSVVQACDAHPPASVAWSVNLGGALVGVHPEVREAVKRAASLLVNECSPTAMIEQACPRDLDGAKEAFATIRANRVAHLLCGGIDVARIDAWLDAHAGAMAIEKPEALFELHRARAPGWQAAVGAAEETRQGIESSFVRFFSLFDVLVCPASLMPPFDADIRYPSRMAMPPNAPAGASLTLPTYAEWLLPCSLITLAGLPAITVPVGTSADGKLPIGVQLVGRPGGEAALLAAAALLERAVAKEASAEASAEGGARVGEIVEPRMGCARPAAAWDWDGPRTAEEAAKLHGMK